MNKKMIGPVVMLIFVAIAYLTGNTQWLNQGNNRGKHRGSSKQSQKASPPDSGYDGAMAAMRDDRIIYTKHAKCRMGCRFIDKGEINEILKRGKINQRKSNINDSPCPTYAVEGVTSDKQTVRIVFADCGSDTKVITAIDLKTDHKCECH